MVPGVCPWIGVFLLFLFFKGVDTSSPSLIHKRVGDSVDLPSGLQSGKKFEVVQWTYYNKTNKIVSIHLNGQPRYRDSQFKERLKLSLSDFNLTVRDLTLQDSGEFSVISDDVDYKQTTTTISLQVHVPITQVEIHHNSTWLTVNQSCIVWLECSTTGHTSISYTWWIGNQSHTASQAHFFLPLEEEANVICTAMNPISENNASERVRCRNDTAKQDTEPMLEVIYIVAVSGGVLILGFSCVIICYCRYNRNEAAIQDNTIYDTITDITLNDRRASITMNTNTIYETVNVQATEASQNKPQTVYDKINFNRPPASASTYQHVI